MGISPDWLGVGFGAGDFLTVGTPGTDGDWFAVPDFPPGLEFCCVLVCDELAGAEVEEVELLGSWLGVLGEVLAAEVIVCVGWVGNVATEGSAITSMEMRFVAARTLLMRSVIHRRNIPKTNKWITKELKITVAHNPGGSK